jgi:hypothetical protein
MIKKALFLIGLDTHCIVLPLVLDPRLLLALSQILNFIGVQSIPEKRQILQGRKLSTGCDISSGGDQTSLYRSTIDSGDDSRLPGRLSETGTASLGLRSRIVGERAVYK